MTAGLYRATVVALTDAGCTLEIPRLSSGRTYRDVPVAAPVGGQLPQAARTSSMAE